MAVYKKDGKWYFKGKYKLEDGTWKNYNRFGGKTKKEALETEKNFLSNINEEKVAKRSITFLELKQLYLNKLKMKNKASTYMVIGYAMNKFESLDHLKINLVKRNTVERFIQEMGDSGYSIRYINKMIKLIKSMFNFAVKEGFLKFNPFNELESFKRPNELKKEMECWTYDEFTRFSNSFDEDSYKYRVCFDFLYYMGTRKGEALALTWKDVDFEKNTVKINKTVTKEIGGVMIASPKTENSYRTIKMPKVLREELQEFYEFSKRMYCFNDDFFIFFGEKPIAFATLHRAFERHIKVAGVKKIRIHDLRHSHASFLINNGANDKAIADRLGNTVTMVREVYSHLFQETEDQLINIIDENTY